jgi:hypothetical protein
MMSDEEKQQFGDARPYLIGAIAALFAVPRIGGGVHEREASMDFDRAEIYVREFERRNGINAKAD